MSPASETGLTGIFAEMANLSDTEDGTLKDTGSNRTLNRPDTGSVTNLSGTFAGVVNLNDAATSKLNYPPSSTRTLAGANTGLVTNLPGTFAGMAIYRHG
jgi:hypothetical protein